MFPAFSPNPFMTLRSLEGIQVTDTSPPLPPAASSQNQGLQAVPTFLLLPRSRGPGSRSLVAQVLGCIASPAPRPACLWGGGVDLPQGQWQDTARRDSTASSRGQALSGVRRACFLVPDLLRFHTLSCGLTGSSRTCELGPLLRPPPPGKPLAVLAVGETGWGLPSGWH